MLTLGKLSELIKELAPTQYNSIIIDNAVAIKEYRYCYSSVGKCCQECDSPVCGVASADGYFVTFFNALFDLFQIVNERLYL